MRALIKEKINTQLPQIIPQAVSDFANPMIEKNVTESVEVVVLTRYSSQPMSIYEAAASLSEFELTKILIDKMEKNKSYDKADNKKKLYDALVKSYNTEKDLFDSYGEVFSLKRTRDDSDKDRDPSAGSDRGKKRRKSSKDVESSRDSRSKEKKSSSTSKDVSQSQHKSSGKSAHAEDPSHTVEDSGKQQDQEFVTGDNDEQPIDKEVTKDDWFNKIERPLTLDPDWKPPTSFDELNDTSFDFSAFVINRLKIPNLTQEILVGSVKYDQHAYFGTLHWSPKRQSFYGYASNLTLSKDVYSRRRIITVTRLTIMKKYDYGHLEEIKVRRDDQKLYTFKEGYRQAIVSKEVDVEFGKVCWWKGIRERSQATGKDNMTLSYFVSTYFSQNRRDLPRDILLDSVVVLRYEKRSKSKNKGKVPTEMKLVLEQTQQDLNKQKRVMRADDLYKFSDGTLKKVRDELHHRILDFHLGYKDKMSRRKWTAIDKKRSKLMVELIDKQMRERQIIKNLEQLVGARELEMDYKLMTRTV
ncbi:hypothetical protein Tco_0377582 [Tanacetum coccineum]